MSFFGIEGYQPRWLTGIGLIEADHGERLRPLVGRTLTGAWLLWETGTGSWFADAPVVLDFDGEQVEIVHQKFRELSITWNTIDPGQRPMRPSDDDPCLLWRDDAVPELTALVGNRLRRVDLLESAGDDLADGMVAPFFVFGAGVLFVYNALDQNGLAFAAPDTTYRQHLLAPWTAP